MRINRFVALATGKSRRAADELVEAGRLTVNGATANLGQSVTTNDQIKLDNKPLLLPTTKTIILNKPVGYVVSRQGQGSKTVYDLLPDQLSNLKPVGRLDKDSSGLLLLTNDGHLANKLTHPSFEKKKVYELKLNKSLSESDKQKIEEGIELQDGLSKLGVEGNGTDWTVTMSEGRNRQIRRTFEALGYRVTELHRTQFGDYKLSDLAIGKYIVL